MSLGSDQFTDQFTELLDELDEFIDQCPKTTFSNRNISVDKVELRRYIGDIRMRRPHEISEAQRITNDRDRIIDNANQLAYEIEMRAREEASFLVSQDEIYRQADEEARNLLSATEKDCADFRAEARAYLHEKLNHAENMLRSHLNLIKNENARIVDELSNVITEFAKNRDELRGI